MDVITTLHLWTWTEKGQAEVASNSGSNYPKLPANTDYSQFHRYGCLWTPTLVQFYFDDVPYCSVNVGPGTIYDEMNQQHLMLLLGAAEGWPLFVDWVRVWQ